MLRQLIQQLLASVRRPRREHCLARIREAMTAGRTADATRLCDQALRFYPDDPAVLTLSGAVAHACGDTQRTIELLTRAVARAAHDPQPALGLANVLHRLGRLDEAVANYERALGIDPDLFLGRLALGELLYKRGELKAAEPHLRKALEIEPDSAETQRLLTLILYHTGRVDDLRELHGAIQHSEPSDGRLIFMAMLVPACYQSVEEVERTRAGLGERLNRLIDGPPLTVRNPVHEIGITPFYLAYHGLNDCDLQTRIVRVCRKAYRPAHNTPIKPRRPNGKIRIGLVSEHFNFHSVGRMNHAFASRLRRDAFEVTVFSLREHDDDLARKIRADSDRFVGFTGQGLAEVEQTIAEHKMDVLFFPDVGMDPLTYFLAYSRLAPLQLVSWGHPDTTGLETLDAFISSDVLETPAADSHYTEELVRLKWCVAPGYVRPERPQPLRPRAFFSLSDAAHIYACPQSPFKIHPDFDEAMATILRSDPKGEVVFVEGSHGNLTDMLKQRFGTTVADVAGRIRILPRMSLIDYHNFIAVSDVMLDPIHFGGGNTSYESLAMGVPVVTLPKPFLRSRPAYGCYSKMEMSECIVQSVPEYTALATRLAMEPDFRRFITQKIAERSDAVFGDYEKVTALEDYLLETVESW